MTVAEREGFEPSIRKNRITDFESVAFDLSAISPHKVEFRIIAKIKNFFTQIFGNSMSFLNSY